MAVQPSSPTNSAASGIDASLQTVLAELSNHLWRERRLLDCVEYALDVQQALVVTGRTRHLEMANRELEAVSSQLSKGELARAVTARGVAAVLDLPGDATLSRIAAAAPTPWNLVFEEHLAACTEALARIDQLSAASRELLSRGLARTTDLLDALAGAGAPVTSSYSARGETVKERPRTSLVDRHA